MYPNNYIDWRVSSIFPELYSSQVPPIPREEEEITDFLLTFCTSTELTDN